MKIKFEKHIEDIDKYMGEGSLKYNRKRNLYIKKFECDLGGLERECIDQIKGGLGKEGFVVSTRSNIPLSVSPLQLELFLESNIYAYNEIKTGTMDHIKGILIRRIVVLPLLHAIPRVKIYGSINEANFPIGDIIITLGNLGYSTRLISSEPTIYVTDHRRSRVQVPVVIRRSCYHESDIVGHSSSCDGHSGSIIG